ncbi:MAG: hypothetical protein WC653_03090, partial [Candidatus Gracilibacteria bacterium]
MRKLLSAGLLSVLLTTLFSFPAYAEDEEGEEDKVDDISDEVESALDDLEEVIFEEAEDSDDEGEVKVEGGEITVEEEEVADEDLSIDVVEEFDAAAESGDYPDKLYLSVQWGYFPAEGEDATEMGAVTWNGDISFENSNGLVKARPFKLIG